MEDARSLLIRQMTREADGIVALVLVDPEGCALPGWSPGAHIDIEVPPGAVRQYSLCGQPDELGTWRIAILKEPNGTGGSRYVHEALRPGMTIGVHGPRNNFPLADADRYLFIAGGIGITPILPMISKVAGRDADWQLLYGGRHRSSMAFLAELSAYGSHVSVVPEDEFGLLDLKAALADTAPDAAIYCCGPEPLIAAVERTCSEGLRPAPYVERFKPDPNRPAAPPTGTEHEFEVVLEKSGLTLVVPPDRSILEVVEEAGVMAFSSCREGYCGCCETAVLEGEVDHRDDYLFGEDRATGKKIMICVSRSRSPHLVLDL